MREGETNLEMVRGEVEEERIWRDYIVTVKVMIECREDDGSGDRWRREKENKVRSRLE